MPRLAPKPLHLDEEEKEQLRQFLNRHSTPQQIALRANIVLLADAGRNHRQIRRDLNVSLNMAKLWRERWLEGQEKRIPVLERLQDEERSGAPAKFTMEQVLQLFKIACDDPADYNRPISHWTSRELAEEMVKQKIVESISERQVGRFMTEATLKPHKSGYWLNPPPTNISTKRSKTFVKSI